MFNNQGEKMSKEYEQARDNFMREFGIVVTKEEFLKRGYLELERLFRNTITKNEKQTHLLNIKHYY